MEQQVISKKTKLRCGGTTDCNSNRLRLELAMNKDIRTGKKARELWVIISMCLTRLIILQRIIATYITQFYGSNEWSK